MAQITGQAGSNLSAELATYLSNNQGNLTSEQLSTIINQYLTGGDKLGAQGGSVNTGIYKRFGEFDQVTGKVEVVTTGMWSGDSGTMIAFFPDTGIAATENYYTNVFNKVSGDASREIQYAVSYGNINGLGSQNLTVNQDSTLATKATYSQYRSILLEQDDEKFSFLSGSIEGGYDSDDIYIINIARARYRESMDAGNFELTIGGIVFIDDSGKKFSDTVGKAGRVFNIVEGSLNLGTEDEATVTATTDSAGRGFGKFYPDQGILILNPVALGDHTSMTPTTPGNSEQQLQEELQTAITEFGARRTENVSTAHYFVRATNREYNFSNNPTFVTGSDGTFTESSFERDPKTYITTVGLYNETSEMLAVAKTSQPIPKSFDKEVLLKVKLDF